MSQSNKHIIKEDLAKSDISKELKGYISSDEFKTKIEKIVKDKLKNNKELEDQMLEISKNVLTQLYKTLWLRRNTWINNLSNKKN